jgi:hypothetical protein
MKWFGKKRTADASAAEIVALTPKQQAWAAEKEKRRADRRVQRGLSLLGVPHRLRSRSVRIRTFGWWLDVPAPKGPKVPRGRLSNPTVLR